ncbi:helix-turn-helix domain-containing protein [Sphingomonas daechungensis]|uniref:helix-turn-helix domain-containing protein n=1 Tax=Sphingomonas daechungensis TaxID=1176646 RepID=UPI003783B3C1
MSDEKAAALGRPSSYDPSYAKQVVALCRLGATDEEIADFFEVSTRTIHRWKLEHKDFCHALKAGKNHADERVVRSLYQQATGFYYVEKQAIKVKISKEEERVEVVEVEKYARPDTTAAIFWSKNRRKEEWRDKQEVEHSGAIDVTSSAEDGKRKLAALIASEDATCVAREPDA